jgi:hypothetical protein
MICEKAQMSDLPFDINHFPIHSYAHTEEGIPYREIDRFRKYLTSIIKGILSQDPQEVDSPVHTFLKNDLEEIVISSYKSSFNKEEGTDSFVSIMNAAEKAKDSGDFGTALKKLSIAKTFALENMTLKDNLSLIITRQALCTYKFKKPTEHKALLEAQKILEELKPLESHDIEVLGLSGAVNKRLYEITLDINYLNNSIHFYEEGFYLKKDYYNGINATFMLYKKASLLKSESREWGDIKVDADSIRNRVLKIVLRLELEDDFSSSKDVVWVLFTIAEVYNYKKDKEKQSEYEKKALNFSGINNDQFAPNSYQEQKEKIEHIFEIIDKD